MTVVIGNRLSDAPAGRPASAAGGGRDRATGETAGFGHLVDDAGKRQARDPAGPASEKSADKPAAMPGNIAFTHVPASEPSSDGPNAAKGERRSGKADTDSTTDDDAKSKDAEAAGQTDAAAPLLAALNALAQRNGVRPAGDAAKPQSTGTDGAAVRMPATPAQVAGAAGGSQAPALTRAKAAGSGMVDPALHGSIASAQSAVADTVPTPPRPTGGESADVVRPSLSDSKETTHKPETAGRDPSDRRTANTVTVTHERSFPAPAAHAMSPTAARVVEALAAGARPASQAPVPVSPPAAAVAVPTHMLKIELHPAELGIVTANLRLSAGQLSVELKPETTEAYRRLSADTDTIANSLKKLGFDVDTVSVMQPSVAIHAATRADSGGAATAAMPGRDTSQFQSGTSGGSAGNPGGQQSGRNGGHEKAFEHPAPAHRERAGGSLFI